LSVAVMGKRVVFLARFSPAGGGELKSSQARDSFSSTPMRGSTHMPDTQIPLVVAIGRQKATGAEESIWTKIYQRWQAGGGGAYRGFLETYTPRDREGQTFADKATPVQAVVAEDLELTRKLLTTMLDASLTSYAGNCEAFADIVLDGRTLVKHVPAQYLMYLELKLQNAVTVFETMPVRSEAAAWLDSPERDGMAATPEIETQHMAKVRQHKIAPATPEHQQVLLDTWQDDVWVGKWKRTNFSGAVPEKAKRVYVERARQLLAAVQEAKVRANATQVPVRTDAGKVLTDFLLDGNLPRA
jgi:hypothetical protein